MPMVVGRRWLDRHGAQGVEGRLEGLALNGEPILKLLLICGCRLVAYCYLRGSEARPLVAVQKHPRAARGRGRCLARWWRLPVECCGRGEDPVAEFRTRYCRG